MAEQIELLEHHANARARAFIGEIVRAQRPAVAAKTEALSADAYLARIPLLQMVDATKQRALARAARPEQRDDFAGADRQVEPVEHSLLAVGLAHPADLHGCAVAGELRVSTGAIGLRCFCGHRCEVADCRLAGRGGRLCRRPCRPPPVRPAPPP